METIKIRENIGGRFGHKSKPTEYSDDISKILEFGIKNRPMMIHSRPARISTNI